MTNPKFTPGQKVYWRKPNSKTWQLMDVVASYDQPAAVRLAKALGHGALGYNREEWIVKPEELMTVEEYEKQPS